MTGSHLLTSVRISQACNLSERGSRWQVVTSRHGDWVEAGTDLEIVNTENVTETAQTKPGSVIG